MITVVQVQPIHLFHYERRLLVCLIAPALVRGLLYMAVIPPWQSQDEEFHFTQARLLLPPAPGQKAEDWQRELLDSLKSFRFYELGPSVEAMACGCPVVCSNVASLPELAGDAALLVNPYDVEELAGAIRRVLSDRDLRADLVARRLARARHFSWERAARQSTQVYRQACLD